MSRLNNNHNNALWYLRVSGGIFVPVGIQAGSTNHIWLAKILFQYPIIIMVRGAIVLLFNIDVAKLWWIKRVLSLNVSESL